MIRFRLFGFPVHIHLSFLLVLALLLGTRLSSVAVVLWGASILISVMLHELGHAAAVRRFGGQVEGISLYALGGATIWREGGAPMPGWKHFLVAAAGSGVGLFAGMGLYLFIRLGGMGEAARLRVPSPWRVELAAADFHGEYLVFLAGSFIWVSVVWGLVNWLPIGGLDGSKMLRVVLIKLLGPSGDLHSRIIGLLAGGAAAVWFWQRGMTLAAVLVAVFAGSDLFSYRRPRRRVPTLRRDAPPSEEADGNGDAPLSSDEQGGAPGRGN